MPFGPFLPKTQPGPDEFSCRVSGIIKRTKSPQSVGRIRTTAAGRVIAGAAGPIDVNAGQCAQLVFEEIGSYGEGFCQILLHAWIIIDRRCINWWRILEARVGQAE